MRIISLHINEKQLIKKSTAGDRKAQKRLYEKHAGKMLSICRQYVAPIETAEEMMLNGFFKAFTKLDTFNHSGSFEGWLRRIMVRECIDYLRKRDPFRYSTTVEDHLFPEEEEDILTHQLSLDIIQECIDGLPAGYRTVFTLCALDNYKHREVAALLDITESTSKSQYRKARLMVKEKIESIIKKQHEA